MSLLEFMRDHLALTIIIGVLLFIVAGLGCAVIVAMSVDNTSTPSPTPIVNASTPTPTPISTPTPAPTATPRPEIIVAPVPWHGEDYDQYMRELDAFYNKTETPRENRTFPDPLTYNGMQAIMKNNTNAAVSNSASYVPGHPETANGSLIFLPTPIPSPTPTPTPSMSPMDRERHQTVDNVAIELPPDHEGKIANVIAWDQEHTRGLYDYYSPGDHVVLMPRFVNNYCPQVIKDPTITVSISKYVLGQWIQLKSYSWIEKVTLPAVQVDQYEGRLVDDLPSFTTVYEMDVPDKWDTAFGKIDTEGYYLIEVQVDLPWYKKACWFSKQVKIL